ncbi:MAG: AbrB/MazE/SpoVT family DNA-binding domain-containing protein [Verrucomicrobiota bacterium]
MKAKVSEKGQVTIPKKLREQLGIRPGAVLQFEEQAGKLVAAKSIPENPFEKWVGKGALPFGKSIDEYLDTIRDR